jgi:hypothetical protein
MVWISVSTVKQDTAFEQVISSEFGVENQKVIKNDPLKPIHAEGMEMGIYIIIFDLFSEHRTNTDALSNLT